MSFLLAMRWKSHSHSLPLSRTRSHQMKIASRNDARLHHSLRQQRTWLKSVEGNFASIQPLQVFSGYNVAQFIRSRYAGKEIQEDNGGSVEIKHLPRRLHYHHHFITIFLESLWGFCEILFEGMHCGWVAINSRLWNGWWRNTAVECWWQHVVGRVYWVLCVVDEEPTSMGRPQLVTPPVDDDNDSNDGDRTWANIDGIMCFIIDAIMNWWVVKIISLIKP